MGRWALSVGWTYYEWEIEVFVVVRLLRCVGFGSPDTSLYFVLPSHPFGYKGCTWVAGVTMWLVLNISLLFNIKGLILVLFVKKLKSCQTFLNQHYSLKIRYIFWWVWMVYLCFSFVQTANYLVSFCWF